MIVFLFAGFLYFFFQGYYPSIDFSIREIFSTGGVRNYEGKDIIKSFGIINVSAKPKDALILLGSGTYANDEKRMTNYGEYTLNIGKSGYIPYISSFEIARDTPYYIDILTLLPRITYTKIGTEMTHVTKISDTLWTAHSASGMILLTESFTGQTLISSWVLTSIGEGYFLSGSTLMSYNTSKEIWERKIWSGSISFIKSCEKNLSVKEGMLWCPEERILLTEKGKTMTGIIAIGKGYLETTTGLVTGNIVIPYGSGVTISKHVFIQKDALWYTPRWWNLVELSGISSKKTTLPPIQTRLDEIEYAEWIEGNLIIIGRLNNNRFLYIYDPKKEELPTLVAFPEVTLDEVRIEKRDGNLFFKTRSSLLFLYHNSQKIEWLIDGTLLAFASESALYEKDGEIWKAEWKWEE
jgi:hypothetical protein